MARLDDTAGTDEAAAYAVALRDGGTVRLRPLRDDDLSTLEQWWNDPAIAVFQSAHLAPGLPGSTAEQFREWSRNADATSVAFCIERIADGALAGHAALWGNSPNHRTATFGILIGPGMQGQGLGTEATRLMLRYGFEQMGLHRITLQVYSYNSRGIAAYRRAGFVEEGRLREAVWQGGRFHDQVVMGILEHEWRDLA